MNRNKQNALCGTVVRHGGEGLQLEIKLKLPIWVLLIIVILWIVDITGIVFLGVKLNQVSSLKSYARLATNLKVSLNLQQNFTSKNYGNLVLFLFKWLKVSDRINHCACTVENNKLLLSPIWRNGCLYPNWSEIKSS